MGTSGTATFNPDLLEIYEIVAARAGFDVENGGDGRGGYNLRQFRRDYNLFSQEMSNRGLDFGTIVPNTIQLQAGQQSYYLTPDTLDVLDGYIRINSGSTTSQTDFKIRRYSQMQFDRIPNKLQVGRPTNWMLQRYTATIQAFFWPVPDTEQPYTFFFSGLRRIQDAGQFTNNVDFPFRYLPLIVAGCSYVMAMRTPALFPRLQMLKAEFDDQYKYTQRADSDRSTFRIVPRSTLRYGGR